ncbi:heparinase II/III domain-containing protein [Geminisphaera colitermitum]|uniref:heparinase II/III domain-containing protein n=1 Tax=Geminisphaera colitermitum TaxID=1148786 RepID=UPI000158C674|nr:heparinase II/III family protein [Geminisphaera colitermitum]
MHDQSRLRSLPLLSLNPAEIVFAAFHDDHLSSNLHYRLTPQSASGCRVEDSWCDLKLIWDGSTPGKTAAEFVLEGHLRREHFDHLVFCLVAPPDVEVRFFARVPSGNDIPLSDWTPGTGCRMEVKTPWPPAPSSPPSGYECELHDIRLLLRSSNSKGQTICLLWFGLEDSRALPVVLQTVRPYEIRWDGLIALPEVWPQTTPFDASLLFSPDELPALRRKLARPEWCSCFRHMETRARESLRIEPEHWLGDFIPWSDTRYTRTREHGAPATFNDALVAGFSALVLRDLTLARHALRHLMVIAHTTHWYSSAIHRLQGSTWDERCFLPEMTTTAVALLADWFDWALTPVARALIHQCLWDKGLAPIERDMMKWDYVYHINQGPWFCRARILAGLLLEKHWPRMGRYVDRARDDLLEGLNNYLMPDGGSDEGAAYFLGTMETTLPALLAHAKVREIPIREQLPTRLIELSENYIRTLSAVRPGCFLTVGDAADERAASDAICLLAGLFPNAAYTDIAQASLAPLEPGSYYSQYWKTSVYACIFGPEKLPPSRSIVPEFSLLPNTGLLSSLRRANGHSLRLLFTGAKAGASHSHFDKGNFILEVDDIPVFIDRGITRYDDARTPLLKQSALHNVITPMTSTGVYPDQAIATADTLPDGRGDAFSLDARICLDGVWKNWMHTCHRELHSPSPTMICLRDHGALLHEQRVAFHLQSPVPFTIRGLQATVQHRDFDVTISGNWVAEIQHSQELVDWKSRPVWRLTLISHPLRTFQIETELRVKFPPLPPTA